MDPRFFRLLFPSLTLALFYWALFVSPPPDSGGSSERRHLGADQAKTLLARSTELVRAGRWEDALEPSRELNTAFPGNHVYLERMAEIYGHLGRLADEAAMWEQFVLHAPTPSDACPHLSEAYRKQELREKWVDACERCLGLDPGNPDLMFYLAYACERNGKLERARQLYTDGLARAPGYDDMKLGLARIDLRDGAADAALEKANAVLAKLPDYVDALLVKGIARYRQGAADEARALLERGALLSPTYGDFHLVLGDIAKDQGRSDEALDHYERALELDPKNEEARERRAKLLQERPR